MATNFKACSIDGCKGNANSYANGARGWCAAHYQRWRKHGDPLAGITSTGEPERYFREVVMVYEGDECLTWPYARVLSGYGRIWRDGKTRRVHRLVCEEANGPPPTPEHEAAHSCGKGHEGCCTKRHLSWKTPIENQADRLMHGTRSRGERHGCARLTEADVRKIRASQGRMFQHEIAKQFGITPNYVNRIIRRIAWRWLD